MPNQPNLTGIMTLEFAQDIANRKCPDKNETLLIILTENTSVDLKISCIERKDGEWVDKEISNLTFS